MQKGFVIRLLMSFGCVLAAPALTAQGPQECTAAIIAPAGAETGRPMLWKNRDTGELSNRVVYVKEQPHNYLAVVDADDPSGRIAWAGMNDAGFAIMNTASYNLPSKKSEAADQEGLLMAQALRRCARVEDFEAFLKANEGPNLGVTANFGVIDGAGKAWLFEVHNHGFERFDASATREKFLLVTNFSRSGKKDGGAGYLRFDRVSQLAAQAAGGKFSPRFIFRELARDTGHSLLGTPTFAAFRTLPAGDHWIHTRHTINRWDTAMAVVMVGKDPADPGSRPMMWVLPGEPLLAIALPLWVEAGAAPEALWSGAEAPLWRETLRIKALVRPFFGIPEKQEYLNTRRLDGPQGGFLPRLLAEEDRNHREVESFLRVPRTAEELAAFQQAAANRALEILASVR
jgi:hypothetical protein